MANHSDEQVSSSQKLIPLKITLIYTIIGGLWIVFSDRLLAALVNDPITLTQLQTFKGWAYIMATAALLYVLIKRSLDALSQSRAVLRQTEQQAAEELRLTSAQLQIALQRLTFHVENSPLAVIEWDSNFRVQRWSQQAEQLFGWGVEEVWGKHPQEIGFIFAEDVPLVDEVIVGLQSGCEPRSVNRNRNYTKNGSVIYCEWYESALADESGQLVSILSLVHDVTERKHLEEQLRQSQKMEAIGRLAGGVAHDFNNLLTVINGYSELALSHLAEQDRLYKHIKEIRKAGERAAGLTRQLLAFSRQQILQPRSLDLSEVILNMSEMLQRLIGENIELVILAAADSGQIKADPGQIEQVIMNLAVNAYDAMPQGGKLTIEVAKIELEGEYAQKHIGKEPGSYVRLAISDTGMGMDEQTRSHIFEPFFTTKEKGKGTGLGLATVYGIVSQSGGSIRVYSEPGWGTTFKIYFPQIKNRDKLAMPTTTQVHSTQGSETILLVEDEPSVRELVRDTLKEEGYTVLEAKNGAEAILYSEQYQASIHLLLTDVVMPGLSGRQLAEHLWPLRPQLKVLYMSGYTDDAIVHHGVLEPGVAFLQKPFTPQALSRKVREVLEAGPEAPNPPASTQIHPG